MTLTDLEAIAAAVLALAAAAAFTGAVEGGAAGIVHGFGMIALRAIGLH